MFLSKKQISSTTSCSNRSRKSSSFSLHWPLIINSHAVCFSLLISRSSSGHVPNTTFSSSRLSWSSRPLHESFPLFSSIFSRSKLSEFWCVPPSFWILNPFERGHWAQQRSHFRTQFYVLRNGGCGRELPTLTCSLFRVAWSSLLIYSQVVQPDDHWRSMSL